MNLPNKLTMLRVILVPVFMVFAAYSRYGTADFNPTFALIAGIISPGAGGWSPISASLWTRWRTNA